MNETSSNRKLTSLVVLLAVISLLSLGLALFLAVSGGGGEAGSINALRCELAPELEKAIGELRVNSDTTREELNALGMKLNEMSQRLETVGGSTTMDRLMRNSLPSGYVQQVDGFFGSAAARTLLSPKVQGLSSISFGTPQFVAPHAITAPYTVGGNVQYLLIDITILDYYDLQFNVVWDSMEAR